MKARPGATSTDHSDWLLNLMAQSDKWSRLGAQALVQSLWWTKHQSNAREAARHPAAAAGKGGAARYEVWELDTALQLANLAMLPASSALYKQREAGAPLHSSRLGWGERRPALVYTVLSDLQSESCTVSRRISSFIPNRFITSS